MCTEKKFAGCSRAIVYTAMAAMLFVVVSVFQATSSAWALGPDESASSGTSLQAAPLSTQVFAGSNGVESEYISISGLDDFGCLSSSYLDWSPWISIDLAKGETSGTLSITSSNADVIAVPAEYASTELGTYDDLGFYYVEFEPKSYGTATITLTYLDDTVSFLAVLYPETTKLKSVTKASYDSVKLTWDATAGATGYRVQRGVPNEYGYVSYSDVAVVQGQAKTTATLKAPWDKEYSYLVTPFLDSGGRRYEVSYASGDPIKYTLPKASVSLKSVSKAGSKALKLAWKADAGASGFEVYRSTSENYGYKLVGKTSGSTFTDKKVKKGATYYYKVKATYPKYGSVESGTIGQMIVKKSSVVRKTASKIKARFMKQGTYLWGNWSSPDDTFYYTQGGKLYMVNYTGKTLKVYGFNAKMKKVSTKSVKLPKHDRWGGFYHGPDGNNYVAIGYDNYKESKSKTVIKVMKFNKKWKKGKTAAIKGSASNSFEGIYSPFDAGTVSFDMQGNTLYLFTAREMFAGSDGVHHQSNIAFSINTKTMKAKEDNVSYTSHSFNQRVRFKDGTIFLADHGDAYDRAICLKAQTGYGTDGASEEFYYPFKFMGNTGANYTGAKMGGMEVSPTTILVCGTAQPHTYKVAGVKGFGNLKENVFVTVTNRATGKSSVKWLTSINPKKGKSTVGEARMVKLSDDRFAILYSVKKDKSGKSTFHYDVVNASGKRVLAKTYKNVTFTGASQPVLYDGSICWSEFTSSRNYDKGKATVYKIPALA